jgi:hypothetical protein
MGVGLLPSFSVRKSARVLSLSDLLSVYSNIRATEEVYRASGVRQQRTADPGVRDEFWCAQWFPFATSGDGGGLVVTYFVDFSPSDDGVAGQVVEEVWRIASTGEAIHRNVIAVSLDLFFRSLVDVKSCELINLLAKKVGTFLLPLLQGFDRCSVPEGRLGQLVVLQARVTLQG